MTQTRAEPMVPRAGIMLLSIGVLGGMLLAVWRNNWVALVILSLVLLFILGADVAAMLRAWRGVPDEHVKGTGPHDLV